uniref:ZIP family metal transporter n=1 Tax=candidate division WOR-3 bacterium TaxID=2052148 RepID=A0A7C3YSM7_UNCW3
MMLIFLLTLLSTIVVSLLSLIGIFFILLKEKTLNLLLSHLIAFAGGVLFGVAFLHLLPEAMENNEPFPIFLLFLIGFLTFYLLERFLLWHHCHKKECPTHPFTYLNLYGDGLHNFIDGLIIAGGYLSSITSGIFLTIATIVHELPQEIGDFSLLLYGGFSKRKALFFNFLSALTAVLGAIFGFFLFSQFVSLLPYLLSYAAGNFTYIAASDIIPELHKEENLKKSFLSFLFFLFGLLAITLSKNFVPTH